MYCRTYHALAISIAAVGVLLGASTARADWITLRSGDAIRGVDLVKKGSFWHFTREDGERIEIPAAQLFHHEKAPRDETVEFRGQRVALRKKVEILGAELRQQLVRRVRDVEALARAKRVRKGRDTSPTVRVGEKALERFKGLATADRRRALIATLGLSQHVSARLFAARTLREYPAEVTIRALAHRSLLDTYRVVRDESLRTLTAFADARDKVTDHFIDALKSKQPQVRVRAANALSVLPNRRAVGPLLDTFRLSWVGFGRAYAMQVTQRAYVADYELVSGGTGFAIVEVADPVVKTSMTGVALDVDVRRVEVIARLRALRKASGQNFGTDLARWRRWWEENRPAGAK